MALARAVSIVSLVFLFFLLGTLVAWYGGSPFEPWLRHAYIGLDAVMQVAHRRWGDVDHDVWMTVTDGDNPATGVTRYDPERAAPGLTLITAGETAYLVALDGSVRHRWHFAYNDLPDAPDKLARDVSSRRVYWQRAQVLPDGGLIVMVNQTGSSPDGLALLRLDATSRLLWVRHHPLHHDFDVAPDGTIYALDQKFRSDTPATLDAMTEPLIDEGILVLSPKGVVLRRISIVDAFARSIYAPLVNSAVVWNRVHWGDYLHSNNVEVARAPSRIAAPGQLLISMREVDVIAVLDPKSETVTWAARGSWHRQHDPDFLPNGNIMLFDNKGDWDRGGTTRIIEYDPRSEAVVWQWPDGDRGTLDSDYRGEQQLLPNGNVLINEFLQRRLLEITRDGAIVWEYRCPFRSAEQPDLICRTMSSHRYAAGEFSFPFNGKDSALTASVEP